MEINEQCASNMHHPQAEDYQAKRHSPTICGATYLVRYPPERAGKSENACGRHPDVWNPL